MKLYAADNSELMNIEKIYRKDGNLIADGYIMGAMPVRAVIKPAEVRSALGIMDFGTKLFAIGMLFRGSR
jgi:hypothetical protein